jgi:tetratricopeptide (TPR) repeat protein
MRNGHKPRSARAGETAEVPVPLGPIAAGDQPGARLSLESPEEPAEILVRVSTNELDESSQPIAAVEGDAAAGTTEATPEQPAQVPAEPALATEVPAEPALATEVPADADSEPGAESDHGLVSEASPESVAEMAASEPFVATEAGAFAALSPYEPAESVPAEDPSLQMRLARIHLRTGSLALARAQLESLAGRDLLDTPGTLDLAEVRWRTGDLHGAGEAALAYLDANGREALGFVIAAEVASLVGRHAEARRHVEQAHLRMLTSLDSIFAGMPRKAMFTAPGWGTKAVPRKAPAAQLPEAAAPTVEPVVEPAVEAEAGELGAEPESAPPVVEQAAERGEPAAAAEPESAPAQAVSEVAYNVTTDPSLGDAAAQAVVDPSRVQADTEIEAGVALLQAGDSTLAALHFGIALRMTPESAPAVLGAIGDRRVIALELVRGDALRLLGQESDAGEAYRSVVSALSEARTAAETPAETPGTPKEQPRILPVEAAAEGPEEPAVIIPTDAPQDAERSEDRLPEPGPPISWSD